MESFEKEINQRVQFIKDLLKSSNAKGIIYGNSGGKDSALVGILCKMACDNVLGVIMPCGTKQNYNQDKQDAIKVAEKFDIDYITVDLTDVKEAFINSVNKNIKLNVAALSNIAPRLRMTTLYSIAREKNYIVAGTGNRSEGYMGYFTKWGDGAYDFNPIADLTVTEIYELLKYLKCPETIIKKAPSAGLFEGQTDEKEMGITYSAIDNYLLNGKADEKTLDIMEKAHKNSEHKRQSPIIFSNKK